MAVDLLSSFKEKTAKIKDTGINRKAEFDVMYSTGFLSLDYLNGTVVHVESKDRNFTYNSVGIVDGSSNCIISRSGAGKSTLIIQIAGNIIRPFVKKGMPTGLFIDDLESGSPMVRKCFLLGLTQEEVDKYVVVRNTGITTNNVFQRIKAIRDEKLAHKKDYEYDTGLYDTDGNRIFKMVPTVYVIDSIPLLFPSDKTDNDELNSGMDATGIAKVNTMFSKQTAQMLKEANIILITINHILDEINQSFIPKAAQISGLKQGERLPSSKTTLYLAKNLFRLDDSITLKDKDGYGINGSIVTLTIIKSRTNATKRSIPLIFNKTEGRFDEVLSLFQLLKDEGKINGMGVSSYIGDLDTVKFSQKTFKEKLEGSPELQEVFARECFDILKDYLSETRNYMDDVSGASTNIMNLFNKFATENIV